MSITLRLVNLIDKLQIQNYFIEKDNKTIFTPVLIKFNTEALEKAADKVIRTKGKPYKINDLEKSMLNDLDI